MPALAAEGLDERRLAGLARRIARADEAIERVVAIAAARLWRGEAGAVVLSAQFSDLPAEIALRLLGRAVAQLGNEGPVELGKLEALHAALTAAMAEKGGAARFRHTLAGAMVTFDDEIIVEGAPPRRSAAGKGLNRRKGTFTKAR